MRNGSARLSSEPIEVRRLGVIDYEDAYRMQHELADQRASGQLDHDVLLLLEHPSVYTAGKRTQDADRPTNGALVIDVDRGGRITWHGPGQLVGYPIVLLAEPVDVVDYVRRIEEALIRVCNGRGLATGRIDGRSGVWIDDEKGDRKLGQIGIRVAKGVTLHGFALNVDPDMTVFDAIVPCGIPDAGVTSIAKEIGGPISVDAILDEVTTLVAECLDDPIPPSPGHTADALDSTSPTPSTVGTLQ
ncbi:lipoyl(octanoyl) transferase LipB [Gordonia sp. (in: high G+C Gram-positive bacteria)]|uniref:lipoyl(octanoyl) transferase LipB n=1 Tax=Gordonia sp. (in: high G+C Gram-positive bacteria) TaxID=84139 RepID=UPI00333E9FE7